MKTAYTTPKLSKANPKDWYVWFRFNGVLVKKRCELNRIKDLKQKTREFKELLADVIEDLDNGWNPLVADIIPSGNDRLTLSDALDFAMGKKEPHLAPKTILDYKCTIRFVQGAILALNLDRLLITEAKMAHIKSILEYIHKKRSWSNKNYNKNLGYLQAILSELIQWEIIPFNPAHKIKPLKELQSSSNTPPTPEEDARIKERLSKHHPYYYIFILIEFHTGIRPNEISQLKFNMYREVEYPEGVERSFVLPPEITKTDKERIVPINSHLWKFLEPLFNAGFPDNYFIFARHAKNDKGFVDFMPGEKLLSRRRSTDKWKEVVKEGLGIMVNQYAMKHHGANMKILAGIDLDALKELYGHASKLTTEIYAKSVKRVYRRQIIDLSPAH